LETAKTHEAPSALTLSNSASNPKTAYVSVNMIVTIQNEYFHKRRQTTGLKNGQEMCSL
jgi:hypothetical protein